MSEIPEGQMTTQQAAEFLDVSPASIWLYIKKGSLKQVNDAAGRGVAKLLSIVDVKKLKADRAEGKVSVSSGSGRSSSKKTAAPSALKRAAVPKKQPVAEHRAGFEAMLRWILDGAAVGALTADEAIERIRAELAK